jgi:hypothetical protein
MRSASSNSTRMGGKAQADGGHAGAAERAQFPAAGAERVSSRIDARARRGPVFHPSGSSPHLPFRLPTRVPNRPPPFNDRLLALFFSDENRPERPRAPRRGESGETREPRSGLRAPRLSRVASRSGLTVTAVSPRASPVSPLPRPGPRPEPKFRKPKRRRKAFSFCLASPRLAPLAL